MKIRIGDITLEQFDKMCNGHPVCGDCPLNGITMCLRGEHNLKVEIPDEIAGMAERQTPET